jgi:hypothetical protein
VLQENKLFCIEMAQWRFTPNIDEQGFNKCVLLDAFNLVYLDHAGKVHNLLPKESVPSYNNFMKMVK